MNRLLIIAKNSQFPRVSTRPALRACKGSSHPNCKAGLSSGAPPDAATGGPRQVARTPSPHSPPVPRLGVHLTIAALLAFSWVAVAIITLVLL